MAERGAGWCESAFFEQWCFRPEEFIRMQSNLLQLCMKKKKDPSQVSPHNEKESSEAKHLQIFFPISQGVSSLNCSVQTCMFS